ncbi:MAG: hypothetical protein ABI325_03410 [Ginsengibacter sp.]
MAIFIQSPLQLRLQNPSSMHLSKKERKTAREIIEKGLQKELEEGLSDAQKILQYWENKRSSSHETYRSLYKQITDFDKQIAQKYDGMTASNYLLVIIGQLRDGFIFESDLQDFPEDLQLRLKSFID